MGFSMISHQLLLDHRLQVSTSK